MEAVGKNMKTNLTFSKMQSFIAYAITNSDMTIESIQLQGEDSYIDDIYYYELNEEALEETKNSLKAHLNGLDASSPDIAREDSEQTPSILATESNPTEEEL